MSQEQRFWDWVTKRRFWIWILGTIAAATIHAILGPLTHNSNPTALELTLLAKDNIMTGTPLVLISSFAISPWLSILVWPIFLGILILFLTSKQIRDTGIAPIIVLWIGPTFGVLLGMSYHTGCSLAPLIVAFGLLLGPLALSICKVDGQDKLIILGLSWGSGLGLGCGISYEFYSNSGYGLILGLFTGLAIGLLTTLTSLVFYKPTRSSK